MDQKKIGSLLKELRTQKGLTQEQLAEKLNVTNRTVSRWENGNNMPDLSIIVELADFYDINIRDLLNGERKSETMDKDLKETLDIVAEYSAAEKKKMKIDIYIYLAVSIFMGILVLLHLICFYQDAEILKMSIPSCISLTLLSVLYSLVCAVRFNQMNGKKDKAPLKTFLLIFLMIALGVIVVVYFYSTFIIPFF